MKLAPALLCLFLCASAGSAAAGGVHMVLKFDIAEIKPDRRDEVMTASVEVVSRRLAGIGAPSAVVSRQGADRVVAEIPDYSDLGKLREIFDVTGTPISVRLVDEDVGDADIRAGRVPDGVEVLKQRPTYPSEQLPALAVYRSEIVTGERIVDAQQTVDPQTGEPVITFRFDSLGATQFAKATEEYVGKRFAIVFKGRVISAPLVVDPIRGGSGMIAGHVSVAEASDIAVELRRGALQAPCTIMELKQTP